MVINSSDQMAPVVDKQDDDQLKRRLDASQDEMPMETSKSAGKPFFIKLLTKG